MRGPTRWAWTATVSCPAAPLLPLDVFAELSPPSLEEVKPLIEFALGTPCASAVPVVASE